MHNLNNSVLFIACIVIVPFVIGCTLFPMLSDT
jgi:hypothetical protein